MRREKDAKLKMKLLVEALNKAGGSWSDMGRPIPWMVVGEKTAGDDVLHGPDMIEPAFVAVIVSGVQGVRWLIDLLNCINDKCRGSGYFVCPELVYDWESELFDFVDPPDCTAFNLMIECGRPASSLVSADQLAQLAKICSDWRPRFSWDADRDEFEKMYAKIFAEYETKEPVVS